ncbi:MAG: hypothetical protein JW940_31710 [Polyangiaceae bacterium]|nr:hypothetical protein [Polyangiaceae bacterium]
MLEPSAGCASLPALEQRVRQRSGRIRFVSDRTGHLAHARVAEVPDGGFSAELKLAHEGASPSSRQVEASECLLALDALALVIAVTFDPDAVLAPSAATPASGSASAAPSDGKQTTGRAPSEAAPAAQPRPEPSDSSQVTTGPLVQATWGPAPDVMPGFGWQARMGSDRSGLWAPALGVSLEYALRSGFSAPGGRARFQLLSLSFDLCPSAVSGDTLSLRACLWACAGRLTANGYDTLDARTVRRSFWVTGASLLPDVKLGSGFSAFGVARGGIALVRDEFRFEPAAAFHRVSALAFETGLGMSYELL